MVKNEFRVVLLEHRFRETLYKYTLALHYLTAVLRNAGYKVFDYIFENETNEYIIKTILEQHPNLVGMHFYRENAQQIFAIAREIKKADPAIKVIIGGHTASLYPIKILQEESAIDLVVYGEGERTIVDLCAKFQDKQPLNECKGIFYRENDCIMKTPPQELVVDLDLLPLPTVDVLRDNHGEKKDVIFSAIASSRGCLGKCSFCITHRVFNGVDCPAWRGRTPENVVDEIEYLIKAFPGKRIVTRFIDGSFEDPEPREKNRLAKILDLIEARNLKFAYTILTRADSWTEEDLPLIKRMKRLGLYEACIGFEGSTPHSLQVLNKRATVEDNIRADRLFKECGVFVFGFLIMFHPYATFEELRSNAIFLKEMGMAYQPQAWWSELDLFPDTRLFPNIVQDGLLLGPEPSGYQYRYGFIDGRVGKIHKALNKIRDSKTHMDYRESIEKIKLEILLYDIWKEYDEKMFIIKDDMDPYIQLFKENCEKVGALQYNLFIQLLDNIDNLDDRQTDSIMKNWDEMLAENHVQLEKEWVRKRMAFGRKKIILI